MADPLFEIDLEKPGKGSRGAAATLYQQLKAAIIDGRLLPGARLPPSRSSESFFGVSRNTAIAVYERLLHEGYVVARHGSGTHVAKLLPDAPVALPGADSAVPYARLNDFWLRPDVAQAISFWWSASDDRPVSPAGPGVDLRPGLVDSRLFPYDVFRRVMAKQLRGLEREPARYRGLQGVQGNYRLRAAITQHIAVARAVACRPEDVIVTSGAQQAFDLLARTLVGRSGAVVAVEDPGYPPMRVAFAAAGARLAPIPVDGEGLIVDELPADTDVVCLCPSHQFPLGVSMSPERRKALIAFARRRGAVIVEDDYDGEFRYHGSPLAALKAQGADLVFYVGTFSKCMLPALRLGFIIAPEWARSALVAAKNCLDWHSSAPLQAGVGAFIAEGHLTRHVRKMRHIYQRRRAFLLTELKKGLGDVLEPIPSFYGMHVTAELHAPHDVEAVVESLALHNVTMHSLRRYYLGHPARAALIFGFGFSGEAELDRALSVLRDVLQS